MADDFLQSRREKFLNDLLASRRAAHQSSFQLDEETVRQVRTGRQAQLERALADAAFADRAGDEQSREAAAARFRAIQQQQSGTPASETRASDYLNAIFHNPLDDFMICQYHMQLSIVDVSGGEPTGDGAEQATVNSAPVNRTEELRRATPGQPQSRGAPRVTRAQLMQRPKKVIAWTGSATNAQIPDDSQLPTLFGIKNLNFKTYNAPTVNNPSTATTAEASMVLLEPYTFSFDQVLSDVAADLGYEGVSSSRVIFRIDIWFSGWAEDGQYYEKIAISNPFSSHTTTGGGAEDNVFTLFMHLVRVNAKVNRGNSELTLNFVPVMYTPIMAAAEYLAIPGDGLEFEARANLDKILNTLEGRLNAGPGTWLVQPVNDAGVPEGEGISIQKYNYEIICPPDIGGDIVFPDRAPDVESLQNTFHGQSVVNVISMLVRSTETARQGLAPSSYPRVLYTVRVVADYGDSQADEFLSDYKQIKIKFIIEPFYDFRFVPNTRAEARDAKGERLAALISSMSIRRVYWYDHFGLNTEVLRFDQDLNNFYFKNVVDLDFNASFGGDTRSNQSNEDIQSRRTSGQQPMASLSTQGGLDVNESVQVADALGVRVQRRSSVGSLRRNRAGPLGNTATAPLNGANGTTQTGNERAALYENEFQNLVQTDLIQLNNMEVRGDPRWLFGLTTRRWDSSSEETAIPIGELRSDCIMVNVMTPKASAYMPDQWNDTPMNSDANRAYDLTGFYQIAIVEHTFDSGLYTQKFTGSRIIIDPVDPTMAASEQAEDDAAAERLREQQRQAPPAAPRNMWDRTPEERAAYPGRG